MGLAWHRLPTVVLVAVVGLGGASPAWAQWAPTRQFTVREGLAQSQVTALCLDGASFLWIATQGGLSRFDGRRFVTFTTVTGLPDDVVSALAPDRDGSLWIGTDSGALARFDRVAVKKVDGPFPWHGPVAGLHLLGHERLLVAASDGLFLFGAGSVVRLLSGQVTGFAAGEGVAWALVDGEAVRVENDAVARVALPAGHAPAALAAADREAWLATDHGTIVHLPEGTELPGLDPKLDTIRALLPRPNGELWLGGIHSLWRRRPDGRVTEERLDPAGRLVTVQTMLADREGSLWVGTWGQGLFQLTPGATTLFTPASGLASSTVWSFAEDAKGCVWMATEYAGVACWCRDAFQPQVELNRALPTQRVLAIAALPDGSVWAGTQRGLLIRRPDGSMRLLGRSDGLPHEFIRAILPLGPREVWLATSGGIARFDGVSFTSFTPAEGLPEGPVRGLAADRSGVLWLATHNGGVVRFEAGRLSSFTTAQGLPHNRVWTIAVDSRDRVWAGTDAGVWVHPVAGGPSRVLGQQAGLPSLNILFLLEDSEGFMWVGSTRGVARVDPELRVSRTFTAQDGFADSEAAENAAMRDSTGQLWFGMSAGVTRVDPRRLGRNTTPPPLAIRAVEVNGVRRPEPPVASALPPTSTRELVLGPGVGELRFDFAALSLASPDQVRFSFMLKGYDDAFCRPTEDDHATYRRLPPGRYRFLLSACNNDGVWTPEPLTVPLRVLPAWYQTGAFRLSSGLVLLALASGVVGGRVVAQRRRQRELERQVALRTAELQAANTRISAQNRQLEELSRTDPLTALANRRVLGEQLPLEMAVVRREAVREGGEQLASFHGIGLIMLDLDHFKEVNDSFGHEAGDRVLGAVAQSLLRSIREVDLAVRLGGEEFVVLARGVDRDGLECLVDRLQRAVADITVTVATDQVVRPTASIGFLQYPLGLGGHVAPADWLRLLELVDKLLYLAKLRGRARACGRAWKPGATPTGTEQETLDTLLRAPAEDHASLALVERPLTR